MNDAEFLKTKADGYEAAKWAYQWERDFALEQATRLRAIAERIEWRPISEAPKDGTHVLLLRKNGQCVVAYWDSEFDEWMNEGTTMYRGITHWQPLPQPPEQP